jgi:hypothetical protein
LRIHLRSREPALSLPKGTLRYPHCSSGLREF